MEDFRVVLNSSTNEFYANSEVHGTVYFENKKQVKAKTITVLIYGRARATISTTTYSNTNNGQQTHTTTYSSVLPFINEEQVLWKSENGSNIISAGYYLFHFKFFIPKEALPNMSFYNGSINYYVKALMDVPFGKYNRCYFLGFNVLPYFDLNCDNRFATPRYTFVEKKGLKITIKIPKTGFACGEPFPFNILIENKSNSKVKCIEYSIQATATFTVKSSIDSNSEVMNEASKKAAQKLMTPWEKTTTNSKKYCSFNVPFTVAINESKEFNCEIIIPSLPPSFGHHEIIKLEYAIFVKVHTRAIFSSGPFVSLPIVIGTIPLRQPVIQIPATAKLDNEMFPPPSHEIPQSEFQIKDSNIREDEQGIQNITLFKPRYAYFHGWYKSGSPIDAIGEDCVGIYAYGSPSAVVTSRISKYML